MLLTLVSSSNAENARNTVGLHRPLPAGRDAADPSQAQRRRCNTPSTISAPSCCRPRNSASQRRERKALQDLRDALSNLSADVTAEAIQDVLYDVGRRPPFLDEKKKAKDGKPGVSLDWFNMLYQVLLGQEKGPRFGSFVAVYGLKNTLDMIDGALARSA
jgi:lysyl-tRNA synthetase class 1